MQPLRKQSDPAITTPPMDGALDRRAVPVDDDLVFDADGDAPVSPALLLRQHLAQRLAEAAPSSQPEAPAATELADGKWPMAMRVMTIVTISLALWSGIFLVAANIITK